MGKKLTIEFVRISFKEEGYILLSKEYTNNKQKLKYICPKKHECSITWHDWQSGSRCSECGGSKKLTIGFIREQFKNEGYTLLSNKYIRCSEKLKYMCPDGHCCSITWDDWKHGCRCSDCFGSKKLTIGFIKNSFEKEGYILLTKEYISNKHNLEYICPKNHCWYISWNDWQQGHRCTKCAIERRKGQNNSQYNYDLTNENRRGRRLIPGYSKWKYAVKERDNFTCQICGDNRGGNLVSHHLYSYMSWPELRIVLENGVCLCEKCHKEFHCMYGYNTTKEQFEKFKLHNQSWGRNGLDVVLKRNLR